MEGWIALGSIGGYLWTITLARRKDGKMKMERWPTESLGRAKERIRCVLRTYRKGNLFIHGK